MRTHKLPNGIVLLAVSPIRVFLTLGYFHVLVG